MSDPITFSYMKMLQGSIAPNGTADIRGGEAFNYKGPTLSPTQLADFQNFLRQSGGMDMREQRDKVARLADGSAAAKKLTPGDQRVVQPGQGPDPKANDPKANDPKANDPKAKDPKAAAGDVDPNSVDENAPSSYRERGQYAVAKKDDEIRQGFRDAPGTDKIAKMQEQWKKDGIYDGNIDGMWGPKSQKAYNADKAVKAGNTIERNPQTNTKGAIEGGDHKYKNKADAVKAGGRQMHPKEPGIIRNPKNGQIMFREKDAKTMAEQTKATNEQARNAVDHAKGHAHDAKRVRKKDPVTGTAKSAKEALDLGATVDPREMGVYRKNGKILYQAPGAIPIDATSLRT